MKRRLIEWLLEEDLLDLADGLRPKRVAKPLDTELDVPEEDTQDEYSIADAEESLERAHPLRIVALLLLIVALIATAFVVPDPWLGPLAGPAAPLRDPVRQALGLALSEEPAVLNVAPSAAGPAPRAVTGPVTAAAGGTAPTTPPAAGTAATLPPEAMPEAALAVPVPQATAAEQWWVVAGPLPRPTVPPPFDETLPYGTAITTAARPTEGREVISTQPIDLARAEEIRGELEAKGLPVKVQERDGVATIRLGPFFQDGAASQAAVALVGAGVAPQNRPVTVDLPIPWLNLGPFLGEDEAQAVRRRATEALGVGAGLRVERTTP